jgi:purine-binding chemotaxis protein CheW
MAASGGSTGVRRLLACRVGTKICGLPLDRVIETMRPLPAEPLAQMASFVSGVALIRGRPTPVVDARKLLGSDAEEPPTRYVTLGVSEAVAQRVAALAVDGVLGVRDVAVETLDSLQGLLGEEHSEVVAALGTLDTALLLVLEGARLLPETTWQALEQESPA